MAANLGVKVYTIGFGTSNGQMISFYGRAIRAVLDEDTLKKMATITAAEYYHATTALELTQIYQKLTTKMEFQTQTMEISSFFAAGAFVFAVAASVFTFAAQTAAYVALPFYFLNVLGRDELQLGMLMGAWPIGTAAIAVIAGRMTDRYSAALLSGLGAGVMTIALLWLALLPHGASNMVIMGGMFLAGLGFGFFQTPNNHALLSGAPRQRSGAAGGLQSATRVFGQSFGTALVAVAYGLGATHGATMALVLAAVCSVMAVAVNTVRSAKLAAP